MVFSISGFFGGPGKGGVGGPQGQQGKRTSVRASESGRIANFTKLVRGSTAMQTGIVAAAATVISLPEASKLGRKRALTTRRALDASVVYLDKDTDRAARMFEEADTDGSGTLERDELPKLLQELGLGMTPKQFEVFCNEKFDALDTDNSGSIDFEEFMPLYNELIAAERVRRKRFLSDSKTQKDIPQFNEDEARAAFSAADADGSGTIDPDELPRVLEVLGLEMDPETRKTFCSMLFAKMDSDGSGEVTFEEFIPFYADCIASEKEKEKLRKGIETRVAFAVASHTFRAVPEIWMKFASALVSPVFYVIAEAADVIVQSEGDPSKIVDEVNYRFSMKKASFDFDWVIGQRLLACAKQVADDMSLYPISMDILREIQGDLAKLKEAYKADASKIDLACSYFDRVWDGLIELNQGGGLGEDDLLKKVQLIMADERMIYNEELEDGHPNLFPKDLEIFKQNNSEASVFSGKSARYLASLISECFKKNGYNFSDDGKLNIVGVRNPSSIPDCFDDCLIILWCTPRHPDSNEGLSWKAAVITATTDPGLWSLQNPMNVNGTAILVPGQYKYARGVHFGSREAYEAMVQAGPVRVWRDPDCDETLDFQDSGSFDDEDYLGINIHRAASWFKSETVGGWSAGCQVMQNKSDFDSFISVVNQLRPFHRVPQTMINPDGTEYLYTLLEQEDLLPPEELQKALRNGETGFETFTRVAKTGNRSNKIVPKVVTKPTTEAEKAKAEIQQRLAATSEQKKTSGGLKETVQKNKVADEEERAKKEAARQVELAKMKAEKELREKNLQEKAEDLRRQNEQMKSAKEERGFSLPLPIIPTGKAVPKDLQKKQKAGEGVKSDYCKFERNLVEGDNGKDVECLQAYLQGQGLLNQQVGDNFSATTSTAVKRWQKKHNLEQSGMWGPTSIGMYKELNQGMGEEETLKMCTFSRDLGYGIEGGADVSCLQDYLHNRGFLPEAKVFFGYEDHKGEFGEVTEDAVRRWQQAHDIGSSGFFGTISRNKYHEKFTSAK